jgi:Mg2+ and Co2+ transporter CorA
MTLDKLYIDEAKRIRKTYLKNLVEIVKKEDEIQRYFDMIEDIRKQVEENGEEANNEFFVKKLLEINDSVDKIKNVILPHYEVIKKLDDSQKTLYNNIRDKYPEITDDEIQSQVVPHILPIDKEFAEKNVGLYNKIMEKQNNFHQ